MNDTLCGAIIGFMATLSGTAITLYYQHLKDKKSEQKLKAALLEMFIISVESYEKALSFSPTPTKWDSSFWKAFQLETCKYFPEEVIEFHKIIFNNSSFLRVINKNDSLSRLSTLRATLLAAKAKIE